MGLLDLSISMVIILFILSIMTEKFTQLVKDYPTVFNALLILLSVAMLVRRVMIALLPYENLNFNHSLGIALVLINSLFIWLFIKCKQGLVLLLFVFIIVNAVASWLYAYNLYLTASCILIFTCLTSLKIIPEIIFALGKKRTTTRFFKRIKKRTDLPQDPEKREKEITSLSFTVGLIIAFFFKGDFFTIINDLRKGIDSGISAMPSFGWDPFPLDLQPNGYFVFEQYRFDPKFTLGLLLTGFFLSFGSKFFHDLLETLFYAKRAKAALSDGKTYEQGSADNVREWVNNYDIEELYARQKKLLLSKDEITGIAIGTVVNSRNKIKTPGIVVYAKNPVDIQANFKITKGSNQVLNVPYEVVPVNDFSIVSSLLADVTVGVTNANEKNLVGSFTYPVEILSNGASQPGNYVLTCYHVVKHSSHRWTGVNSDFTEVAHDVNANSQIGRIVRGGRNTYAEASVVKLNDQIIIQSNFLLDPDIKIVGTREVTRDDIDEKVFMYSRKKKQMQTGWIRTIEIADKINFKDNRGAFEMHNLIQIEGEEGAIQEDGDSGNLLFDRDGYALGIVFARQERKYTLAMRINKALELLNDDITTIKIKTYQS